MSVNWNSLRLIGNSLNDAFEELCCQLAELENPSEGKLFIRKGTPDAGVECYWQLKNDDEIGWQAKFFDRSLDDSQWSQLDSSFRTALDRHPKLVEYIVCLPLNLPDGRIGNTRSARDKWNSRVSRWEEEAKKLGRSVKIGLWDETALLKRLARPTNRGLLWFFFDTPSLTVDWFAKRARESIENAGNRYDRELHIENAEQPMFEALVRSKSFWTEFGNVVRDLERVVTSSDESRESDFPFAATHGAATQLLAVLSQPLARAVHSSSSTVGGILEWDTILAACDEVAQHLSHDRASLEKSNSKAKRTDRVPEHDIKYRRYYAALFAIRTFATSIAAQSANAKGLLIVGTAGQGKTHTSCRWTQLLIDDNAPVILVFGEQFNDDEPWNQIIARLGLRCDRDQFIGALAAAARVAGRPALLILDGLNEGPGNHLWRRYLAGMVECLRNEPWIRLCITVRDIYEDYVIPDISENTLVRLEHVGFAHAPDLAAAQYFEHYGISPSTPLLDPEFDNPLFLKLFCKGLQARGVTDIPRGMRGITAVLDFFLESVNKKLARQQGFDARDRLVQRGVELIAKEMSEQSTDRITLGRAKELINGLHFATTFEDSLFRGLESEMILTLVPEWHDGAEFDEKVRFVYQRFSDHLIARHMLDGEQEALSGQSQRLQTQVSTFLTGDAAKWDRFGLVQALAIQLPETFGIEIFEFSESLREQSSIRRAVCDSLRWRAESSFTVPLTRFLEPQLQNPETLTELLDTLISFAVVPGHPFNSLWLDRRLKSETMPLRDSWWSTFLYLQADGVNTVSRLIKWCWKVDQNVSLDSETIELAGIVLCWLFTTPHRSIRDRATKAAVNLFLGRINDFIGVYKRFIDADDPYLSERLHAVACGIALRSFDDVTLSTLASVVYDNVFADGSPPEHLLVRDYARQVVAYASHRGCFVASDTEKSRPPYGSSWIAESEFAQDPETSRYDDIGRYVDNDYNGFSKHICDFNEWSSYRINQEKPWSPDRSMREFEQSLTDRQWKLLLKTDEASNDMSGYMVKVMRREAEAGREEHFKRNFEKAIKQFEASIGKRTKKWGFYVSEIQAYVHDRRRPNPPRCPIHPQPLRNWLKWRARDLGWTRSLFGEFDDQIRDDREEINTEESIAKKYVWIAVRELQARLADNFELRDSASTDSYVYDGPWRIIWGRDIDPTNTLSQTGRHWIYPHDLCWWAPTPVDDWHLEVSDQEWSRITTDLPDPRRLIEVTNQETGKSWWALDGYYCWMSPDPIGTRHLQTVQRKIYYIIRSYVIHAEDAEKVGIWSSKQRWTHCWMPENEETFRGAYSGEFFWSEADNLTEDESASRSGWIDVDEWGKRRLPAKVLVTSDEYHWEQSASDSSLDDGVNYSLPSRWIVEAMQLERLGTQSQWYDSSRSLVAYDPSVHDVGPSVLLMDKSAIDNYLSKNELAILFTVRAERELTGGSFDHGNYIGHVEANGAYILNDGKVSGEMRPKFFAKGTWAMP